MDGTAMARDGGVVRWVWRHTVRWMFVDRSIACVLLEKLGELASFW